MSGSSASTTHNFTKGGEFINSAKDTYVHKSYYNLNIVSPDVTSFFHFAAKHLVAWIGSRERDPVEISDIVPPDPSSLPPISSIADRYTRSMLECTVGYPLYNPEPFSELSMEYSRNGVNIGDVGFVREDGTFDFLFNICPSKNGLINPPYLPDGFSLETPDHSTTRVQESLPRSKCIIPRTVEVTESGEYICKGSEGAILELPEGATRNEAIKKRPFEDLAKLRGVQWYEYAMTRGRNVSNGSLYVITSFTKCTQWGIAVFDRPCHPGQGLTFVSSPLSWKGPKIFTTKVANPKRGDTPNQCVFFRGCKIMIRPDIFNNLCNDQPRGSDPAMVSSSPQAGSISLTRQPAQRIRGGGGTDILSRILPVGKASTRTTNFTVKKLDKVALRADLDSFPFHPSDVINAALLRQNPDAKVAITHDDVWCDLLQDNFPTLNYATLIGIARSYTSIFDGYGAVSLEKLVVLSCFNGGAEPQPDLWTRISDPFKVVDDNNCPVGESETSAVQEPIQGIRDEHDPDTLIQTQAESRCPLRGTETPILQEPVQGVRDQRDLDNSMPTQVSNTLQPQSINRPLGAVDESSSVTLVSSPALITTAEPYIPRDHYGHKATSEKVKANESRDMYKIVQKYDLNLEDEKRRLEFHDPFEHFMNKLTSILQEIPKDDSSQTGSPVSETTAVASSTNTFPSPQPFIHSSPHSFIHYGPPFISSSNPVDISDLVPAGPSVLPVATVADRYIRSMLGCMVGYPLYNPEPFSELSMEYSVKGVDVGDVGFVRRYGTFDCLFNICPSQKGFINPPNLPDGFSLETREHSERFTSLIPRKTRLFSPTITRTRSGEYICKGFEGAVLELPEGATQADAINTKSFEDLAKLRGVQWYEYALARGRSISNGSLCLITSVTKCTQWGIAVFDRPCGPGQGLKFNKKRSIRFGKPTLKYRWNGSCGFLTKVSNPNQGDALNQCVFLRGYKITIRQDIFDNLYNGHSQMFIPPIPFQSYPTPFRDVSNVGYSASHLSMPGTDIARSFRSGSDRSIDPRKERYPDLQQADDSDNEPVIPGEAEDTVLELAGINAQYNAATSALYRASQRDPTFRPHSSAPTTVDDDTEESPEEVANPQPHGLC